MTDFDDKVDRAREEQEAFNRSYWHAVAGGTAVIAVCAALVAFLELVIL